MSTKSASTPRRRSSPAANRKVSVKQVRSKGARKIAARAATPKRRVASVAARRSSAAAATPPPLSGRAVAAARAKLAKLGSKWKELLPRLKKVTG